MIHDHRWFKGYYACGPGDDLDAEIYPWGWESPSFDDSTWVTAEVLSFQEPLPGSWCPEPFRQWPATPSWPQAIRRATRIAMPSGFLESNAPIQVPKSTRATVLFDFGGMTMGYPELTVAQGRGSSIKLKYAEALYEREDLKAHRDSVDGKQMFGVWDIFRPDGPPGRTFRPLWKRAFRYVQLEIETQD